MKQQQLRSSDNYKKLIQIFKKHGLTSEHMVSRPKIQEIYNQQAYRQIEMPFQESIVDDIWGECESDTKAEAKVQTVCMVTLQAVEELGSKVQRIKQPNGYISKNEKEIRELELELMSQGEQFIAEDYNQINQKKKKIARLKTQLKEFEKDAHAFQSEKYIIVTSLLGEQEPIYHEEIPTSTFVQEREIQKQGLLVTFHITNIGLCLELLALTYKLSFLSLLGYLQVHFWLFVGYYSQKKSVPYMLLTMGLSILLDVGLIVVEILTELQIGPIKHSSNGVAYIVILGLIVVSIIVRLVLIVRILPFRTVSREKYYFNMWGSKYQLNRRVIRTHPDFPQ